MLRRLLLNFAVSLILTIVVSITSCTPQNDMKFNQPIKVGFFNNNNKFSFLGIRLQTYTSFPEPRIFNFVDSQINSIPISEKPLTPYPIVKQRIKYVGKDNKVDVLQTDHAGELNFNAKNTENDEKKYHIFTKDARTDTEGNSHKTTTESRFVFPLETTTDVPSESTINTTETDEYASTTVGDEDPLNRMAVPSQVVASLLG